MRLKAIVALVVVLMAVGGMVYWLSDLVGMGSNLEAIFIKPDA